MHISPAVHKYLVDPLERAGSTFAEQLLVFLMAGSGSLILTQNWAAAAATAGFAAMLSLLTSYTTILIGITTYGWVDVVRRVVLTGLQSFFGILITSSATNLLDVSWKAALGVALNAAGVAFLKAIGGLALPATIGGSVVTAPVAVRNSLNHGAGVFDDSNFSYDETSVVDDTPGAHAADFTP